MGDKAIEADCAVFGMLSQFLWNAPGSPFEQLLNGNRLIGCVVNFYSMRIFRRIQQLENILRTNEGHILARLGSMS